jgi:uncharacterized protein (DUF885 family)
MKKSLIALLFLALAASCGGGSSAPPAIPDPPVAAPPTPAEILATNLQGLTLTDFYFESYKALILRSPELVVWEALTATFPLNDVDLDDLSDTYQRDTFAMYQVVLDALRTYDRSILNVEEQLTFDVYEWHLQDVVDQLEFIYYDYRATYSLFGTQQDTRRFFTDIHPLATQQDAEDYITRLNAVSRKFSQLSDHLMRQRSAGIVEPELTMQVAINQITPLAQGAVDTNPYYTRLLDKVDEIPGLSAVDRQNLLDGARAATLGSVIPGYQELLQTLQSLLSSASPSIGVGQFPRGAEYYAYILRHHTTTDLTAAEIHQLGLDELQRVHFEMRIIFDQLGYPQNETLHQLFARVATDGGVIPAADTLATFEALIAAAEQNLDQAFDIYPSADVVVIPGSFGGFYIGPSFDGTRPGAFYAGTVNDLPYYDMPTLTYHESVPGHHTQVALAMEQNAPAFRKLIRVTAFVEGWGLYAERLAYELGWYDNDPYGNLGRLQFEALRAARLVIDTGIHSLGWSFDQATQFNEDNVGWDVGASQSAAGRYSVIPGQATAYMVGMLKILQVRQRAMDELGAQFDLKGFHRALLSNGAVPLQVLDSVVDNYIAETLAVP